MSNRVWIEIGWKWRPEIFKDFSISGAKFFIPNNWFVFRLSQPHLSQPIKLRDINPKKKYFRSSNHCILVPMSRTTCWKVSENVMKSSPTDIKIITHRKKTNWNIFTGYPIYIYVDIQVVPGEGSSFQVSIWKIWADTKNLK